MSLKNQIEDWCFQNLCPLLSQKPISVWLFGSVANGKDNPNDCDLLVIYDINYLQYLLDISVSVKIAFAKEFSLNLHLTRIALTEVEECKPLLLRIFNRPYIVIHTSPSIVFL